MVWFKVDDKLHDHPKAHRAGVAALGLWTMAGSWVSDNLGTYDGFVPERAVFRFDRAWRTLAKRLEDVGLWDRGEYDGEPGWWFHDWKDQNPSRADVLTKRAEARDRMARVRANKRERSREQNANSDDGSREVRDSFALPRPDPTRPDPKTELTSGGKRPETLRAVPATQPPEGEERCSRHPNGNPTNEPCNGCKRVEDRKRRREDKAAEKRQREDEDRARSCPTCEGTHFVLDADKLPTRRKCDHRRSA